MRADRGCAPRWALFPGLLLLELLCQAQPVQAVHVYIDPEISYAEFPATFTVSVMAADFDSTRGCTIDLEFNPGVIDFVSAERGLLFHDYTPPYGLYWAVQDNGTYVRVETFIIPADECVAGPGELLRLTFAALPGHAESPLHFLGATVRDCEGTPIEPFVTSDGRAVIGPEAELFFAPDPKMVFSPEPFDLSLSVSAIDSLRGFQVYLDYDNTALEFDSAMVGDLLGGESPPHPLWWYVHEESPTRVRIEGVILGPGLFVNGPGELVKLEFAALIDSGETPIVFHEWHLWDVDAQEFLPVHADDGLVIIMTWAQGTGDEAPRSSGAAASRLLPLGGNPGPTAAFRWEGAPALGGKAAVYDISGRIVREVAPRWTGDGGFELLWDGRDAAGMLAPCGVYWLRAGTTGARAGARVVIAR
jgi:hypothetical protein